MNRKRLSNQLLTTPEMGKCFGSAPRTSSPSCLIGRAKDSLKSPVSGVCARPVPSS